MRYVYLFLLVSLFVPDAVLAAPAILDLSAPASLALTGDLTQINCTAQISGLNVSDLSASAVLYDSYSAGHMSPDDNNNHYSSSCSLLEINSTTANATCTFDLAYYANPSDTWSCRLNSTNGNESVASNITLEVLDFVRLGVGSLSFDRVALGDVSNEVVLEITNLGNVDLGVTVASSYSVAMTCENGNVSLSDMRYDIVSEQLFSSMIPLSQSPVTVPGFSVPARTDDSQPSTGELYWKLLMPDTGVKGSCSGGLNVNAI